MGNMVSKRHNLEVRHMTTDPDTRVFKAAEDLHSSKITQTMPVHMMDTRHLAENQRKHIKANNMVVSIMPGATKTQPETLCRDFATDVSKLCQAEFD